MNYIHRKHILIFIIFLLSQAKSSAQEPAMWHLADEDGLASMTVYSIVQDDKAFLWFGTENGLCRYDGQFFKKYSHPKTKGNEIISVKSMPNGPLFFRNLEGQLFYIKNDTNFLFNEQHLQADQKVTYHHLEANQLWLFVSGGEQKKSLIRYEFNEQLNFHNAKVYPNIYPLTITTKNNKLILLGKDDDSSLNIYDYHVQQDSFSIIRDNSDSTFLNFSGLSPEIACFNNGHKFINNLSKIYQIDEHNQVIDSLKMPANNTIKRLYNFNEMLWVATEKGALRTNPSSLSSLLKNDFLFSNYTINYLYQDPEENFWLGTNAQGVYIIPSIDIVHFNARNSGLPDDRVFVIKAGKEEDELIIGHGAGQLSFIKAQKVLQHKNLKTTDRVRVIHEMNNPAAWNDFDFLNHREIIPNPFQKNKFLFCSTFAKSIATDQKDHFWIGSYNAAYQLNIPLEQRKRVVDKRTYALHYDFEQTLWIGTTQGIYKYQKNNATASALNHLSLYSVNDILQSKDSTIWVATQADGLLAIKNDSIVLQFNSQHKMQTNTCKNLFLDKNNHLWIGTDNGIYCLRLEDYQLFHMDKNDGLASNEINAIYASAKSIWVGSPRGLTLIPRKFLNRINQVQPKIHITDITIGQKSMPIQNNYQLHHQQNNLNIEFIGFAYRNRDDIEYHYRLLGLDSNWISTTSRFARFPSLFPGEYQFQVIAINADGVRSALPASFFVKIKKAWWTTIPFLVSMAFLIFAVVGGIVYRRQQYILDKEKEQINFQEQLNGLKIQALQSQMNPHFVFNALSAIQRYLTTNDQEAAMLYLSKFARLIRLIFEYSKIQLISLEEEINFLKLYLELEKLRFGDKVEIIFDIDASLAQSQEVIKIPPLLIQPIIENAFKHGLLHKSQDGKLTVKFEAAHNNYLRCIIEDNGVGREHVQNLNIWKPREYQSSGLSTTTKRLEMINQLDSSKNKVNNLEIIDLKNDAGKAIGTKVIIQIISTSELSA